MAEERLALDNLEQVKLLRDPQYGTEDCIDLFHAIVHDCDLQKERALKLLPQMEKRLKEEREAERTEALYFRELEEEFRGYQYI